MCNVEKAATVGTHSGEALLAGRSFSGAQVKVSEDTFSEV